LDFSLKIGYIGSLKWGKISTNGRIKLHIYFHTNKTLINHSLYVFNRWGKNLSRRKDTVQLQ